MLLRLLVSVKTKPKAAMNADAEWGAPCRLHVHVLVLTIDIRYK